jgi:NTP pyrophosphatase (non-canonical NTP hydrolase)
MVAYIYNDRNMARPPAATFAHFVEVCGMLTIHDRKKRREGLDVTDALCKTLGWYFPLLAKHKIRSVESLIFRKFPRVCPYCRKSPHQDVICKLVRGTSPTVDHAEVLRFYRDNWNSRPKGLNEWQMMFQDIYPRQITDQGRSTIGLLEELGELAEAVRVFDSHPKYFLGEAADTFSYIMGIANEHAVRLGQEDKTFSFETEFLIRYPGLCTQCGSRVCVCPGVPEATVGRMAKEINITDDDKPFISDFDSFSEHGRNVAHEVLELQGGYQGLIAQLPFDRGDANRALVALCLQIAKAIEKDKPTLAETFRTEAFKITASAKNPGSPREILDLNELLKQLGSAWKELNQELRSEIKSSTPLLEEIGDALDQVRVLFVFCSPVDEQHIRVSGEYRVVMESLDRGAKGNKVAITALPAATSLDFRRKFLDNEYDIVHFAGHSDGRNLIFETEAGVSSNVPLTAIAELVDRNPSVRCVILNACESASTLSTSISPCTIGMDAAMDDDVAIEFSRGFYDGLAAGRSVQQAYAEGITAVKLMGVDASHIKLLYSKS